MELLANTGSVFAEEEARLLTDSAATPSALRRLVERRVAGEPLEHLLGWALFRGLRLAVAPGVFVPRRRTELLAERAVDLVRGREAVLVDLCCGCGAVAAAVLAAAPDTRVHAADLDPVAVASARRNIEPRGGRVHQGDLYATLPPGLRRRVDVITANAPYVPTAEIAMMPPEARDHEPRSALDGGPDGVDVHRRICAQAPDWLAPGGRLLIETGRRQSVRTAAAMWRAGLRTEVVHDDEVDGTVVIGTLADDAVADDAVAGNGTLGGA